MNILFFGDLVGKPARMALKKALPIYKEKYKIDLVIANSDNLAHGKGVTGKTVEEIIKYGVDVVTCGDHIWDNLKQAKEVLASGKYNFICPANLPAVDYQKGYRIIEVCAKNVLIINLAGRVFFQKYPDCPFRTVDKIIAENKNKFEIAIVDFHCEATSEKKALGFYLSSRVSAVLGTHTHTQTADEKILDGGTAYISDVGMVGPSDSVLGCRKDIVIEQMLTQVPFKYKLSDDDNVLVNAVVLEIDSENGRAEKIKRINEIVRI
ncbi:MAG: TIGR00282 family metallophosphoesterase [Patescibacteria group bacterium]|nr:TIGR00282 family metallophosphoesterase [Patescibacteria group bacterium]